MSQSRRAAPAERRAGRMALAASGVMVAGAALAVTGVSAMIGSTLVTPPRKQVDDIKVLGVDDRAVRLGRTPDTGLPGQYALCAGEELTGVGAVVAEDADSVVRPVDAAARELLAGRGHGAVAGLRGAPSAAGDGCGRARRRAHRGRTRVRLDHGRPVG